MPFATCTTVSTNEATAARQSVNVQQPQMLVDLLFDVTEDISML